ncbi:hypothetical protein ACJIZ3_017210 [Penstemon smallii]|uniref:Uncharacterized protein n=1 Tax=Penstemon smallii TaxID=265156 RepID=A0ABD3SW28_9LAMI
MIVSLQTVSCFSIYPNFSPSGHQCRVSPRRFTCSARQVSVEEPFPSQIKQPENVKGDTVAKDGNSGSGIQVPRKRYISVSKSRLLDAIVSTMFPSQEEDEARQFLSLSQCLDSILHAEHKSILEEMRADFDETISTKDNRVNGDTFPANQNGSGSVMDGVDDSEMPVSSDFTLDLKLLLDSSLGTVTRNPSKGPRVVIPIRFQRAFMQLLYNAEFEELSPRDLMLSSALNTDYLLTLPIYVDWKKASESSAIIFRRGYATERQKGLLIAEKLDYLQSKLLQNFFFLFAKPLGKFGVWLNEVFKSISQKTDTEVFANKLSIWLKEFSLFLKQHSYNEQILDDLQGHDMLSKDLPIWVAAQKAVTRYEGILSAVGPRERLLRKFFTWIGLVPSTPQQAFDLGSNSSGSESHLSPSFLPRISLSDIWKPASPKRCGNDFRKIFGTAVSILFSQSILQEPAFQELILLYTEETGGREAAYKAEVSSLEMKIYEKIPIPDLPVVFPHKKLSFRILDTVRLDVATILGILAYFLNYKFEDILSSPLILRLIYSKDNLGASSKIPVELAYLCPFGPNCTYGCFKEKEAGNKSLWFMTKNSLLASIVQSLLLWRNIVLSAILLDVIPATALLLVNRTLYEKTIASGFGSIHFLLDASEQQLYKEAILLYAALLTAENGQVNSKTAIGDKCERFLYNAFQEKIEMPVDKAIVTLVRLGLVIVKDAVDGQFVLQALPCTRACIILRNHWNILIRS